MSLYKTKRLLLYPLTAYQRYKHRHVTGFIHSAMEVYYYRPTFFKFLTARINNPQLLHEADIGADSIVLDVGGFVGDWSRNIAERYGSHIYVFEPNPKTLDTLHRNLDPYDNIQILPYGLGGTNQQVAMCLKGMGSSIYAFEQGNAVKGTVDIQIRDVAQVLDDLNIEKIDLLKVNIEGGEYDLLDRMIEQNLMDRVSCLLVQYHEWFPGAYRRRRQITKALRRSHKCVWDYPFVWEKWVR